MTYAETLERLNSLCDEYNIDESGRLLFSVMIAPAYDKEEALRIIEAELKKRGPKEV